MPAVTHPVVVTTEHRGVFFGDLVSYDERAKRATIRDGQMCVYWSSDVRGIVGLAASGPSKSCRVTPAAPKMTLEGVTAIIDATEGAAKAWKERPWQ
jgi:hypothetical protein